MLTVEGYRSEFLSYLNDFQSPSSPKNLYEPVSYILGLKGKRIRPILTLLTCDIFNDNYSEALDAALAVEVFHNFSLVHDDIMDEAHLRRGNQTVHKKWDLSTAILSGDVMLILAYQLFENYKGETFVSLAKLFSKTAIEVCEGQSLDMEFENKNDISLSDYVNMIQLKTSVLVACALKIGAIIGGADSKDANLLYNYGLNLGTAFQIHDDI